MGIMDLINPKKKISPPEAREQAAAALSAAEADLAECSARKDACEDVADMVHLSAEFEIKARRVAKARASLADADAALVEHQRAQRIQAAADARKAYDKAMANEAALKARAVELDRMLCDFSAQVTAHTSATFQADAALAAAESAAGFDAPHKPDKTNSYRDACRGVIAVHVADTRIAEGRGQTESGFVMAEVLGHLMAMGRRG